MNVEKRQFGMWCAVALLVFAVPNAMAQERKDAAPQLPPLPETSNIETYGGIPMEDEFDDGFPAESMGAMSADAMDGVPQVYQIRTGDTLWDICQKLLDNPWYWPKLWSLNQYILNPHLIFPGDRLAFFAGSETAPPKLDIVDDRSGPVEAGEAPKIAEAQEEAPRKSFTKGPTGITFIGKKSTEVRLKPLSFISPKNFRSLTIGEVTHSGEPKMELYEGDRVYLSFKKKHRVSVGDRFQVLERVKKVKNPDSFFGGSLGWLIKRKAAIRVVAIKKNTVDGMIVDCDDSVRRGDKIAVYASPIRTVRIHKTEKPIAGKIIEAENQQYLISNNEFVFLNLGKKHGVDDGTSLVVVRRGDGLFQGEEEKSLPDVAVGHLIVIETQDRTSTAYVTSLRDSLAIGDRVRNEAD